MMFSFVQENVVANFLESKDIDGATKAVKDIKGPKYVAGCVFHNLMSFEKECVSCSSRKYPYSPHRRDWNFLGGGGSVRPEI